MEDFTLRSFRIREYCWIALVATVAASCAARQSGNQDSVAVGCKISSDNARQLSLSACASAVHSGVSLCTPPGPVGMSAMVCQSAANGVALGELSIDPAEVEQNGMATQTIIAPLVMPTGEIAAVAACSISRKHNSVVYAVLTRGPMNAAEDDYLRDLGACSD